MKRWITGATLFLWSVVLNAGIFSGRICADERVWVFLPMKIFGVQMLKELSVPLWNPYVFLGMPHLAMHFPGVFYLPDIIIFSLISAVSAYYLTGIFHSLLAGAGLYLYLRQLKCSPFASLYPAIVFMASGFLIAHRPHVPMVEATSWLPLILFFVEKWRQEKHSWCIFAAVITLALQIFSGYIQVTLMTLLLLSAYILWWKIMGEKWCWVWCGVFITISGIALALVQILPAMELVQRSLRADLTYDSFVSYSLPPWLMLFTFFPFGLGSETGKIFLGNYGGPGNLTEFSSYMGIFAIMVILFSFLTKTRDKKIWWFWFAAFIMALLLAFGDYTPFYRLLYYVPVYKLFRVPARHLLLFNLSAAVLLGLAWQGIINGTRGIEKRRLFIFSICFAAGALLAVLALGKNISENLKIANPAVYLPLTLLVLQATALLIATKYRFVLGFIIVLTMVDLFLFQRELSTFTIKGAGVLQDKERNPTYVYLKEKAKQYRIMPVARHYWEGTALTMIQNTPVTYRLRSPTGFSPLQLRQVNDFLGISFTGVFRDLNATLTDQAMLSMLGVKYLLLSEDFEVARIMRQEIIPGCADYYHQIWHDEHKRVSVWDNREAEKLMYLAKKIKYVRDDEEIRKLWSGQVGRDVAILKDERETGEKAMGKGSITALELAENYANAEVNADDTVCLVFTDNYYPGWRAYIDGAQTEIFCANGIFKAIMIPSGEHKVKFVFHPMSYRLGYFLSLLTILYLGIAFSLITIPRSKKQAGVNGIRT
ncbi:hypothetical protein ES707_19476 [subsurface metagenome]